MNILYSERYLFACTFKPPSKETLKLKIIRIITKIIFPFGENKVISRGGRSIDSNSNLRLSPSLYILYMNFSNPNE